MAVSVAGTGRADRPVRRGKHRHFHASQTRLCLVRGFVIQHYLLAGVDMLMPHIANFLLYVYWRVMNKRRPQYPGCAIAKFGNLRDDGTPEVPNPYTPKWVLPYPFRMSERRAVRFMYALIPGFCAIGLFVPG